MNWEAPSFIEIKMDSEINSYQDALREASDAEEASQEASRILTPHS